MSRVTIYAVTWNSEQYIELLCKRIHETTKHPYRLVVSENRSKNSPAIQKKLLKLKEQGLVDKIYIFNKNYVGTTGRYTIEHDKIDRQKEGRSFYVRTDHDAYLTGLYNKVPDWLEHYANVLEDEQCSVRAIRMVSNKYYLAKYINNNFKEGEDARSGNEDRDLKTWVKTSKQNKKFHSKYTYLSNNIIPTNNHFQAVTEQVMESWLSQHPNKNPIDGLMHDWLVNQHNMHLYIPVYAENLSIYQKFPDPQQRIHIDPEYVEIRKKVFGKGTNSNGYGFHDYKPNNIQFSVL